MATDFLRYDLGETVPLRLELTAAASAVRFKYRTPAGAVTTKIYGTHPEVIQVSPTVYTLDVLANEVGIWRHRAEATVAGDELVEEGRFIVDPSSFPATVLPARALCTLDDVLFYAEQEGEDTQALEGMYARLIGSASREFHRVARREFVAINATRDADGNRVVAAATRFFDVGVAGARRVVRVGDLSSLTSVTVDGVAVADADRLALPRTRQEWQPIRKLRLEPSISVGSVIAVTGVWGFPQIPEDVRQHVVETVVFWAKRDLATFGEVFVSEMGLVRRGDDSLPGPAYRCALSYRRRRSVRSVRMGI